MRLNELPFDVLYNILYHVGNVSERQNIAAKLVISSRSFLWHFQNPHLQYLLYDEYPVIVRCKHSNGSAFAPCMRHARFKCTTTNVARCDFHKEKGMIPFVEKKMNVKSSLQSIAEKGYTSLLKILWDGKSDVEYNFIRDAAIQGGKLSCANWIISQSTVRTLPCINMVLKFYESRNIEGIKTAYRLGLRISKNDILRYIGDKVKFRSLRIYLMDNPHLRETIVYGQSTEDFQSFWEIRLAFYYSMLDLVSWFSGSHSYDKICMDMIVVASSEDSLPAKAIIAQEFNRQVLHGGTFGDFVTIYFACKLDCRKDVFEEFAQNWHQPTFDQLSAIVVLSISLDRKDLFEILWKLFIDVRRDDSCLPFAIQSNAIKIVTFLVRDKGKRCDEGNVNLLSPSWNIRKQPLLYLNVLLSSGVRLPDASQAYELSMEPHKMYYVGVGLLKSPIYSKDYFRWLSQKESRISAFTHMMRFRL